MAKIIWPVLAVLVAVGIFISSSMSGDVSGGASMAIANFMRRFAPLADETIYTLNFIVRKAAHFAVFFALAFCVAHSLKFHIRFKHSLKILLVTAWAIAALYGVIDEVHQNFVPGRVMAPLDMAINAAGAFFGAALVVLWVKNRGKKASPTPGKNP